MEHPDCEFGLSRRRFLVTTGIATVTAPWLFPGCATSSGGSVASSMSQIAMNDSRQRAKVRTVFLYPPSSTFANDPNGWWSWPGTEYDAEKQQARYTEEFRKIGQRLGLSLAIDEHPVASIEDAQRIAAEITTQKPDGLLLVMFYNNSLPHADILLKSAEESGIPAIFYIGLGVKHGAIAQYRRPGVYFIQSLDNFEAIASGMRMINTRKLLTQSRLLSICDTKEVTEKTEPFLGITVRTVPFEVYASKFANVGMDSAAQALIRDFTRHAGEVRVTREALENAARAHLTLTGMLAENDAHGVTMKCLRAGMLKPCVCFSMLNSHLIPAACENDLNAAYGLFLGESLTGRAGFQHNPAYETERNHYYGSHCTCAPRLHGPEGPVSQHILRKFFHSNEGSCAIQTFWEPEEPVTMIHYYSGTQPTLDVYEGKVFKSHSMPPAGGCTTNVEVEITDRADACSVKGHHNILFCGDFGRDFRMFANLHKIALA